MEKDQCEYWEQPVRRHGGPPADFVYVPRPPPQPPQGPGIGPYGVPVYAAPMQYGPVPLQWQQPRPQAKGPDGEASEVLRNVPITLPTLKDVSEPQAALCAGDWLSELMPLISDVSEGARVWWTMVDRTSTMSSGCLHHMADSWSNGSHGCST